ncbi:signal peptidase II [Candidatus Woesearchaeota archaeon]|nr:signal peptidase II [Candidatus Woesearchaeota archaeon]
MNKKSVFLIVFLILIDQLTKIFMLKKQTLGFLHVQLNSGAVFGIAKNVNNIFIIITIVMVMGILYFYKKEKKLEQAFNVILAGAVGNLVDRGIYGGVIDFIDFKIWPVFNLADVFIVGGIIYALFFVWKSKS